MQNDKSNINLLLKILLLHLFLPSCTKKEEHSIANYLGPLVIEDPGFLMPNDSLAEPTVFLVDQSKLNKTLVSKPKVIPNKNKNILVGTPKKVFVGIPKVVTPGRDSIILPIKVPAIDSAFVCGRPEIIIAKDAKTMPQNSGCFSFYTELQGLNNNQINCMLEDTRGNLWFGTQKGGVSMYNGQTFTNYTIKEGLCSNTIRCIFEDKIGNLWFGTDKGGGVTKYDGKYFTHFGKTEGLSIYNVQCILQDAIGNLWFGGSGVTMYDGNFFTHFSTEEGLNNNLVTSMLQDKAGNIWFCGFGATKYDGKSFIHFTDKEGLNNNLISCILQDSTGNIWFGTQGGGVLKYDGKSFSNYTDKEGLNHNLINCMLQDKAGNIWFCGFGASKYDGTFFTNYAEKDGLTSNWVISILQDKNGNLWLGTFTGVAMYNGSTFTHLTENGGLSDDYISSILKDKNGIHWFGTPNGLTSYDGSLFTLYYDKAKPTHNFVTSMLEDNDGNLWLGTLGGAIRYDGTFVTHFGDKEGLRGFHTTCIIQDNKGNLWFGTFGYGITKYDGISFTNYKLIKEGGPFDNINSIYQDIEGNIWIGSEGNGLFSFDGISFKHYILKEGLCENTVYCIHQDERGNLWFGTDGGALMLRKNRFTYFTEKEGISNNKVLSITEDKLGNIWFGTHNGLSKLSAEKMILNSDSISYNWNSGENLFKSYTDEDGFHGIACNNNSINIEDDGTIWIGTKDRLTVYHPEGETLNTFPPNIQLTSINLFNENIDWERMEYKKDSILILGNGVHIKNVEFGLISKWYRLPENLSLAFNNNNLTFNFIGITMNQPKKVKYQYILEGNDQSWSAITSRTEAPYGNLSPGKYLFKVKAMNSDGYWSNEFQYPFTIRPPWWGTWWAYSLYILLGGCTVYAVYQNDQKQIRNKQNAQFKTMVATQEEERKRISRDLHDDIGTKLSALKLFLSALREKASYTQDEEIRSLAENSEHFLKETLQDVRQLLINLSPTVLEEFGYTTAVEGLIHMINETKQIHFDLIVFGINQRLPKDYELVLYRITQELINNVIKHAEANRVSLQIGYRDGTIILMIEDDGVGFDIHSHKDGYGLNNLNSRTKLLKGTMTIDSTHGTGTSVLIEIPFHDHVV